MSETDVQTLAFSEGSAQDTALAVQEACQWITAVTGLPFSDNFRQSLEDGVLLCEFMEKINPGSIRKINRRSSPIAHLDNIRQFLSACQDLGLNDAQLFEVTDLQQPGTLAKKERTGLKRTDADRHIRNVCVTLYWLGRAVADLEDYSGPQLDLEAFRSIMDGTNHQGQFENSGPLPDRVSPGPPPPSSSSSSLPPPPPHNNRGGGSVPVDEFGLTFEEEQTADQLLADIQSAVDEMLNDFQQPVSKGADPSSTLASSSQPTRLGITVHMCTKSGGFGFQFLGGSDVAVPPQVEVVLPGSAAEESGLMAGDEVVSVSKQDVTGLTHLEIVQLIRGGAATGSIVLGLIRTIHTAELEPPALPDMVYVPSSSLPSSAEPAKPPKKVPPAVAPKRTPSSKAQQKSIIHEEATLQSPTTNSFPQTASDIEPPQVPPSPLRADLKSQKPPTGVSDPPMMNSEVQFQLDSLPTRSTPQIDNSDAFNFEMPPSDPLTNEPGSITQSSDGNGPLESELNGLQEAEFNGPLEAELERFSLQGTSSLQQPPPPPAANKVLTRRDSELQWLAEQRERERQAREIERIYPSRRLPEENNMAADQLLDELLQGSGEMPTEIIETARVEAASVVETPNVHVHESRVNEEFIKPLPLEFKERPVGIEETSQEKYSFSPVMAERDPKTLLPSLKEKEEGETVKEEEEEEREGEDTKEELKEGPVVNGHSTAYITEELFKPISLGTTSLETEVLGALKIQKVQQTRWTPKTTPTSQPQQQAHGGRRMAAQQQQRNYTQQNVVRSSSLSSSSPPQHAGAFPEARAFTVHSNRLSIPQGSCTRCRKPLGTQSSISVPSLRLLFHASCFTCRVCHTPLVQGRHTTSVLVRGSQPHCQFCCSTDRGVMTTEC